MLALIASVILLVIFFFSGWWFAKQVFRLGFPYDAILAYPLGMSFFGFSSYFLWLLNIPWSGIVLTVVGVGGFLSVSAARDIQKLVFSSNFWSILKKAESWFENLSPIETILALISIFGATITVAWHVLVEPVVWDSLALYDFRAARIAEGWLLEDFFQQFNELIAWQAYDFSHPFLPSVWQALSLSIGALSSSSIYIGLLLSVVLHALIVLRDRRAWLFFTSFLFGTSLFLTTWTQNYGVEPYVLFWLHLLLLVLTPLDKRPRYWVALVLTFLLISMLCRLTSPYWFVFLFWLSLISFPPSFSWKNRALLLLSLWLPVVSIFLHWWFLQNEAQSWVQTGEKISRSSYDLRSYTETFHNLLNPEVWVRVLQTFTLLSPIWPFFLLYFFIRVFAHKRKNDFSGEKLLLLFITMLFGALFFELAKDWPDWEGKQRLLAREGLPLAALLVLLTVQSQSQPKQQRFLGKKAEK